MSLLGMRISVILGKFEASFAALSAASLISILAWLGTQQRQKCFSLSRISFLMFCTIGFLLLIDAIAWMELLESVTIVILV